MRARVVALVSSIAVALTLAGPLGAEVSNVAFDAQAAIGRAQEAVARQDCAAVLAALDPVVPGLAEGPERSLVQRMRLVCLGSEGRTAELSAVQRELVQTMPRDGLVKAFGALIAADENRFADAAEQIAALADSSPKALSILTGASVRAISMRLEDGKAREARDRMMIALARADWEPSDIPELRIGFAEGAIGALINKGETVEAEGLLERIDQPEMLSAMVVDRHYVKLWPALEARLGPSSGTSVDRFAREKLALYGTTPGSDVALRDAVNAMLLLGRYQDVLDLSGDVRATEGMSRDAVRTLLYRARALAALRRNDEADALFGEFQGLDLRRAPAASTALVSYAEFLDEIGRPAKALTVARDTLNNVGGLLTDFGKRWLDRTEVCSLMALGRTAEANSAMDRLKALSDQNQPAAIEALLCARRAAEASQIAVKAFENAEIAGDLLLQFQPTPSLWAPAPSRLRDLWTGFILRPEIKAAFDRKGRILPRNLWPAPAPRSIPRQPGNGGSLT